MKANKLPECWKHALIDLTHILDLENLNGWDFKVEVLSGEKRILKAYHDSHRAGTPAGRKLPYEYFNYECPQTTESGKTIFVKNFWMRREEFMGRGTLLTKV